MTKPTKGRTTPVSYGPLALDLALLRRQAVSLSEIQDYLKQCKNDDTEWIDALEGVLNLLAVLDRNTEQRRSVLK